MERQKNMTWGGVIIDRDNSDTILNLVLGNIALPIFNITELEMLSNIKEWGYEDVMKNIWFCHTPIGGKPCGLCSPCHTKIDSGMEWLMPEAAIKRCATANAIEEKYGKTMGKIYRRLLRSKMRE